MLATFTSTTSMRYRHGKEINQHLMYVLEQMFSKQLLVNQFEVQNMMDHLVSEQDFCSEQSSYF